LKSMDIDRTVFYETVSCFCWSSTTYANDVNTAWGRHCGQYYTQNLYKGDNHCVRAVRSVSSSQSNLPLPVSQSAWNYAPVVHPIKQSNPADCKPFAVGDLSSGNLSLQVGLPAFSSGVDVYLAIGFSDALFLVDGSNALQSASGLSVLPKWKTNVSTAIDESLYGDIPTSLLPAGVYNLYIVVVPTGETDFSHYYFWATSFSVGN
ncbi:MAG: DUF1566 domain-containing protein, partial [Anaerolineales bacterium]|nr:DUF1566 domain-containing protein [Anaerolineales bacterium]